MQNFIPSQDISTKLTLLNTYHNTILEEYRSNIFDLEFKDFTNEQNYYISKFKKDNEIFKKQEKNSHRYQEKAS